MRALVIAVVALIASCTPPASEAPSTATTGNVSTYARACAADNDQCTALAALEPVVGQSIGQPISLNVTTFNIDGDSAWVVAQPRTPEGGEIDWSQTNLATQATEGVLDGGGTTYALLKRENGQWRVLEHVIGPTDVAWLEWPSRHDVSPALLGLPSN